ncbi:MULTISPECIES: pentapeptide repeat-containing protein [Bacillus]|uniref:pentapeptide repeat-containing protein n=1 Tax=Bacillus TaxID=1386 RepID=UPI0002E2787D|nr:MULTISPECIES: pentapeptide repeat-containing protein [Bacillus]
MDKYLTSDCDKCFGLCCVALPYAKSSDFAFDKDGGDPCRNLNSEYRCVIHNQLREKGFRGCVSYECFGAGQHVSQTIYQGVDWRRNTDKTSEMFAVFPIVQQLHEMICYLSQAFELPETKTFRKALKNAYDKTVEMTNRSPEEILHLDIPGHRNNVNELLVMTSDLVRKQFVERNKKRKIKKGLDYLGANLYGVDFRGASLRGTLLIAANLSNADLRKVDFIGADLRDTDLSNADLTDGIFLTQSQINSAKGNKYTKLPEYLTPPSHWLK